MRKALILVLLSAMPLFAQQSPSKLEFRWDLLLRYDDIKDFPRRVAPGVDSISYDRTRLQLRPGLLYTPNETLTFEGRIAWNAESYDQAPLADGTRKIAFHDHFTFTGRQDNYRADSVVLDRLNVQFRPTDKYTLMVGKFQNPFDTTEVMWDSDLQPEGVAGMIDLGEEEALHSRITAATFVGTQLYGDDSVINAGQYTLANSVTSPINLSLSLGYWQFDDLDVLAQRNWRQNATVVVDGVRRFASDFEIGHALLRVGTDRGFAPVQVHFEHMRNFGADREGDRDGYEAGFRVGPLPWPGDLRFTYIFQDLDRDAVMAGFNGDDWYLHSWYRGSLYRLGATVWRDFGVQATYVDMEHHETTFNTTRLMLDIVKRF
jgi:hypothetical protein